MKLQPGGSHHQAHVSVVLRVDLWQQDWGNVAVATHFPIYVDVDRLDPGTSGEPIRQSGSGRLPHLPHD